jgi:hypothetical protein
MKLRMATLTALFLLAARDSAQAQCTTSRGNTANSWLFGGNGDEFVDAADATFGSLRMWTDLNHDGVSQPAELRRLEEVGILRIGVNYRRSHRTDRYGNEFRFLGRAWKVGPLGIVRPVLTWDVFFLVAP